AAADNALNAKKYEDAKAKYNEASGIKPDEKRPKERSAGKDSILADLAKKEAEEKAKTEQYNADIATADNAMNAKKYEDAKAKYNEASGIKPDEKYPKDKIAEIDSILADLAKKEAEEKAKTEQYNAAIAAADNAMNAKKYEDAKAKYNEASGIKPDEK